MGKVTYEHIDIISIFIEIVFDCLSQPFIEVQGQVVVLENSVQDRYPLLELGICLIIVGKNGG
jgi:hypothetical protein